MIDSPQQESPDQLMQKRDKLFCGGQLINVHVGRWGMSTSLAKEDLGLNEDSNIPDFARLGIKMLMPKDKLGRFVTIEGRARAFLKSCSLSFPPIAQAHFVPKKILKRVIPRLNEYKAAYEQEADDFQLHYEEYKQQMLELYSAHRDKLEPFYPTASKAREKFYFQIAMFEMSFPKALKETSLEKVQKEEQAKEAAANKLQASYEQQMEEQYKQNMEQLNSFIKESVLSVRGNIIEAFQKIHTKLQNKEVVNERNITSLKTIIDYFDDLNFADDAELAQRLSSVRSLLNTSSADIKDGGNAMNTLAQEITSVLTIASNETDVDEVTGRYYRRLT